MAKVIMIQGTMSSVGKSLITAGLCRIFSRDGYRTAPFKSQNMALNSFVTGDGLEMGRAQVMQAEAAGIEPSVLMNPILLKPTSDMGSQVIVNGRVRGTMNAIDYFKMKKSLVPDIMAAFDQLSRENDIVVIEGAGSPAEINLKADDIVNMGMARLAKAPVLLVGDIDRGGVFASLYGTAALLEPEERRMIKGLIINKFRGDVEILRPGLAMLEELIKIPVMGVVPYTQLDIDDEDSLAPRLANRAGDGILDIAVIRLPHISNFTDFSPLGRFGCAVVRYAKTAPELGEPDLVIIPGTKNTMGDLLWMRENGMESGICELAKNGTPVVGICGGYQMLGRELRDPHSLEQGGTVGGMGLLDAVTVFEAEKTLTRVRGRVGNPAGIFSPLSGCDFTGYEIHMGQTVCNGTAFAELLRDGTAVSDGGVCENVMGSYAHGLFDEGTLAQRLMEILLVRKGYSGEVAATIPLCDYKNQQYDKLAETVRNSLDMTEVYNILQKGL